MHKIGNEPDVLILDSNIWLNFLKGTKEGIHTFQKMKKLREKNRIIILVPEQVLLEWNRHYKEVTQQALLTTEKTLEQAQILMNYHQKVTNQLYHQSIDKIRSQIHQNIDMQVPSIVKDVEEVIKNKAIPIRLTEPKLINKIIEFGLKKMKPFDHKNSMGDAVIFFSVYECFLNKFLINNQYSYDQIYFITNDIHDFSEGVSEEEQHILHLDMKNLADEIDLKYSTDIHQTINKIQNKERAIQGIIWDLDNTIWDGDLSKGENVRLRKNIMGVIQYVYELGIFQTIVSKNISTHALSKMKELGIERYFIFPQFTSGSKSVSIEKMARLFHLDLKRMVFIDNDRLELKEVSSKLSQVTCIDATQNEGEISKKIKKILNCGEMVL